MSRMIMALLLTALPLPAAAQSLTSEQAMENFRAKTMQPPRCAASGDPDDITVCGSRNQGGYRLPLDEPTPGARIRGEAVSAVTVAETRDTCSAVGRNQSCGGGLPIMGMVMMVAKIIEKKVLNPDD